MARLLRFLSLALALGALAAVPATAAIDVGSDDSDGTLDPSVDDSMCVGGLTDGVCTIDLGAAACDCTTPSATCPSSDASPDWCDKDDPAPSGFAGKGVYDRDEWAVVFRYSSVNIQPGVTVEFTNNHSRAPVVWLVSGDVSIDGSVDLSGEDDLGYTGNRNHAEPGPGGFRGALPDEAGPTLSGAGLGPGGATRRNNGGTGGSYGTIGVAGGTIYGNDRIIPLIGGSGGSGEFDRTGYSGGAGGGAILIAADQSITVDGTITARHGRGLNCYSGGGAGGSIRLVADTVQGSGKLRADGVSCHGGDGRTRIEAVQTVTLTDIVPTATFGPPCPTPGEGCGAEIWPEDLPAAVPAVRLVDIDGQPVPADPQSSFSFPAQDVTMADPDPVTVTVETRDVPLSWTVTIRVTPQRGDFTEYVAVHQGASPNPGWEEWTASVTIPNRHSAVQVRASAP